MITIKNLSHDFVIGKKADKRLFQYLEIFLLRSRKVKLLRLLAEVVPENRRFLI